VGLGAMRQEKQYWVYIMASKPNGTLYTGVTGNIPKRAYEHKNNLLPGFTNRYGVPRLPG
jgi:putative endonuclease